LRRWPYRSNASAAETTLAIENYLGPADNPHTHRAVLDRPVHPGRAAHPAGAQLAREPRGTAGGGDCSRPAPLVGDITDGDLARLNDRAAAPALNAIDTALRATLEDALTRHGGNKLAAARSQNVSRTTLYKRMQAFGLDSQ
jgi:DNA-binding NtrC family response regulator